MQQIALQIAQVWQTYLALFEEVWDRAMQHQMGISNTRPSQAQPQFQGMQGVGSKRAAFSPEQLAALNVKPEQVLQLVQQQQQKQQQPVSYTHLTLPTKRIV